MDVGASAGAASRRPNLRSAKALRRAPGWTQVSAALVGSNKARSAESVNRSASKHGWDGPGKAGYGGHFRAVQGFRYIGEAACAS